MDYHKIRPLVTSGCFLLVVAMRRYQEISIKNCHKYVLDKKQWKCELVDKIS